VGSGGFEPPKSKDSGFTVRPIWPLWKLPFGWKPVGYIGAENWSRTSDLLITNQLLYQLSYFGLFIKISGGGANQRPADYPAILRAATN
jgi:hypothetical protein